MPTTASGYSCASGAPANPISAMVLIVSTQRVAGGIKLFVKAVIAGSHAVS